MRPGAPHRPCKKATPVDGLLRLGPVWVLCVEVVLGSDRLGGVIGQPVLLSLHAEEHMSITRTL